LERTTAWLRLTMRFAIRSLRTVMLEDVLEGKPEVYARIICEGFLALVLADEQVPQEPPPVENHKEEAEASQPVQQHKAKRTLRHQAAVGAAASKSVVAKVQAKPLQPVILSRELQCIVFLSSSNTCPEILRLDTHRMRVLRAEFHGIATHYALIIIAAGTLAQVRFFVV
jgi:hypothetical protein